MTTILITGEYECVLYGESLIRFSPVDDGEDPAEVRASMFSTSNFAWRRPGAGSFVMDELVATVFGGDFSSDEWQWITFHLRGGVEIQMDRSVYEGAFTQAVLGNTHVQAQLTVEGDDWWTK